MANMILFYCTIWIWWLLRNQAVGVSWPLSGCTVELDVTACVDVFYCTQYIQNLPVENNGYICPISMYSPQYGSYRPRHIRYKNIYDPQILTNGDFYTPLHQNLYDMLNIDIIVDSTVLLDVSDNEYSNIPLIPSLPNLATLIISKNALTVAKLSNHNEFPSLTELDFSYNTINSIETYLSEPRFNRLKKLNISHNYLANVRDSVFDGFGDLEYLDLSYNYIDGLNVLSFEGLKRLSHLYLANNRITSINAALLRFYKLSLLDLKHNKIESIQPSDFVKLVELQNLDLSHNLIVNIDDAAFNHLVSLQILDLSNNEVEIIHKQCFSNISNLHNIDLSYNHLKQLPRDLFKTNNISYFSVKGNILEEPLLKGTFEGLALITNLDLSHQNLTSIEDLAFMGLDKTETILLNDNNITRIFKKSFKSLYSLEVLDLSGNNIINIDFDKSDLGNLHSLLLSRNKINIIQPDYFEGLFHLKFLDLSNNEISQLLPNSFQYLNDLINFQISNNPISGVLSANAFNGLNRLPVLDISGTQLTEFRNSSFYGMIHLKALNVSHSNISKLDFNTFSGTGTIHTIDLSYNRLSNFNVNATDVINVNTLLLGTNHLFNITENTLKGMTQMNKLVISHNQIQSIHINAFDDLKDLRHLDLSYNPKLEVNMSRLSGLQYLTTLFLSGIKTKVTFESVENLKLVELEMSFCDITDINPVGLRNLKMLTNLKMDNNKVENIGVGGFANLKDLRALDLSYNQIKNIEPGSFKDSPYLQTFNISHNALTTVSYGAFRGLTYLTSIDMSYNCIDNLESERFYEVAALTVLILDHNRITSIDADEFAGTSLASLSIGDNPLPCRVLVNFKKSAPSFHITALNLSEKKGENVDGVRCNIDNVNNSPKAISPSSIGNDIILINIRDILNNMSRTHWNINEESHDKPLKDLSNVLINKYNNESNLITSLFENATKQFVKHDDVVKEMKLDLINEMKRGNQETNTLLDRLLRNMSSIKAGKSIPISIPNVQNVTSNLLPLMNKMKQDLEDTISLEKENILNEMERRLSALSSIKDNPMRTEKPIHEAQVIGQSDGKSFVFLEVCVGSILVILICFVLYKVYISGIFVPKSWSTYSTRNLPDAMDNSTL